MRRPQFTNLSIAGFVALHLLIVLPLAYTLNIWSDEASTLYTTQNGISFALSNAGAIEKQAPLYFWLLSLWREIDGSIIFARLFSVICSAAAIALFAGFVRRHFTFRAALLATAFFSLHPFLIWASLEVRVYSLVILLTVVLLRQFSNSFYAEDCGTSRRKYAVFAVVATVCLYTNYYLVFVFGGFVVFLAVRKEWKKLAVLLGCLAIAAAVFTPQVIDILQQFRANTDGFQAPRTLFDGARLLWHHFVTFLLPSRVFADVEATGPEIVRLWLVRAAVLAIAVVALARRSQLSRRTAMISCTAATIFVGLLTAYFLLGVAYVEIRHASVAFVPLILSVASILDDIFGDEPTSKKQFGLGVFVAALPVLAAFSLGLATLYPNMSKRGDWMRAAAFISENGPTDAPVIVVPAYEALALPYYLPDGSRRVLPRERFFEFTLEDEFGSSGSMRSEMDYVISLFPPDKDRVWLAVGEVCLTTEACVPLENFVQANYTIEKEQDLYLEKLFLLHRKGS